MYAFAIHSLLLLETFPAPSLSPACSPVPLQTVHFLGLLQRTPHLPSRCPTSPLDVIWRFLSHTPLRHPWSATRRISKRTPQLAFHVVTRLLAILADLSVVGAVSTQRYHGLEDFVFPAVTTMPFTRRRRFGEKALAHVMHPHQILVEYVWR